MAGYIEYDKALPDGTTQTVVSVPDSVRANAVALVDAVLLGGVYPGVTFEVVDGDPDQPEVIEYASGTKRIRLSIAWNSDDNPSTILVESSTNSGVDWDTVGRKTVSWSDGYPSGFTWSAN